MWAEPGLSADVIRPSVLWTERTFARREPPERAVQPRDGVGGAN
jgi:hypothetical protein